ncbi:MAG TPA: acyl carrier protein [Mycobacteriales bacterium]|nr:acyl carrier protein [Mycobacteriales bacterium]
MSTVVGLTAEVRAAVALVCGVDADTLTPDTTLESLGADSLARVSIADTVEAGLAAAGTTGAHGKPIRIDDATLARFATLGEIDAYLAHA